MVYVHCTYMYFARLLLYLHTNQRAGIIWCRNKILHNSTHQPEGILFFNKKEQGGHNLYNKNNSGSTLAVVRLSEATINSSSRLVSFKEQFLFNFVCQWGFCTFNNHSQLFGDTIILWRIYASVNYSAELLVLSNKILYVWILSLNWLMHKYLKTSFLTQPVWGISRIWKVCRFNLTFSAHWWTIAATTKSRNSFLHLSSPILKGQVNVSRGKYVFWNTFQADKFETNLWNPGHYNFCCTSHTANNHPHSKQ